MVHKNLRIDLLVKSLQSETPGYWSVTFDRPINFHYEAGDWIDIGYEGVVQTGGKTYSLSSSPSEPDLQITFKEGLSPLKKALRGATAGDKLTMTQYGNDYGFQLHANKSSVLIAGGVGIAPFRSMLKEMFDQNNKTNVQLIYLNQNEDFLFKNELDAWLKALPNLSITYISTKELNRKKREKLILSLIKNPNQNFYISGPPAMVESNEHLLIDTGVQVRDIRIDSFGGY
jgi:ferredoxin-NADP reductase